MIDIEKFPFLNDKQILLYAELQIERNKNLHDAKKEAFILIKQQPFYGKEKENDNRTM